MYLNSSGGQVRSMQYFAKFNVEILYDDVVCAFSDINATFGRLIRARRVESVDTLNASTTIKTFCFSNFIFTSHFINSEIVVAYKNNELIYFQLSD